MGSAAATTLVVLAFEGPDAYSRAGGLGARVTELTAALARSGYETHLFFVGDPDLPGHERREDGRLHLHRWCQWISQYHPGGVYDGEEGKLVDWNRSLVPWMLSDVVAPAVTAGGNVVVLAEEWQTVASLIALAREVEARGWGRRVDLVWNANHFFGFDRIAWGDLNDAAVITTVSRYMKSILDQNGVESRIVPNGIAEIWFASVDSKAQRCLARTLRQRLTLVKVARWAPDKGWPQAIDATADLKRGGLRPILIARGGSEGNREETLSRALGHGLSVATLVAGDGTANELAAQITQVADSDVVLVESFLSIEQQKLLFRVADAVLANSSVEPFGLVGLETMASGGIAFVGVTGEDYATPGYDSVAIETADAGEIVAKLTQLQAAPAYMHALRRAVRSAAKRYSWTAVLRSRLIPLLQLTSGTRPRLLLGGGHAAGATSGQPAMASSR